MTKKLRLFVVPHTHWDREWYGSYQLFRVRLVRLMNKLLDLLERDPDYRSFNLDGQSVILEDYLEIHPEKRSQLEQLVSEKRLLVGPWYILPDSFLCGAEIFVRNLMLGRKVARDFGHSMDVGYVPDTFGHIGQLPQILQGFELANAMHFRGMDVADLDSELWWEAPDGSRVMLLHMSNIVGYSEAAVLSDDPERAALDLRALAYYKAERATTDVLLALQGVDHVEAREDLSNILRVANETIEDVGFIHANLEEFWAALSDAVDEDAIRTVKGELRSVPRQPDSMNFLLYNVLSSRADNKLDNATTLTALQRWAEPWAAQSWLWNIADYPSGHLWTAWRWMLKNHPHDSIGGCSVDEVHRQMATRFEWACEIADYLTEERFRLLAQELDYGDLQANELALTVFNPTPWSRHETISVDIDIPLYWLKQQALANHSAPPAVTNDLEYSELLKVRTRAEWLYEMPDLPSYDFRGLWIRPISHQSPIPLEITNIQDTPVSLALASGPRGTMEVKRVTAQFHAEIPSLGYTSFGVSTDSNPIKWPAPARQPNCIENEHLRVHVNTNGTFNLTNKATGYTQTDLGLFEDGGDSGDGYMYSPPHFDGVYTTLASAPRVEYVGRGVGIQRLRIHHKLEIPVSLNDDRRRRRADTVVCPLTVDLILRDDVARLEMAVTFDNRARDHRLRILFPTDLSEVNEAHSSMQFDVVTRPIAPEPIMPGDWWVEDPPSTFPMHGWMDIHDDTRGLAILSEGVYEFAVGQGERREVALTLLRAVGFLGARRDLTTIIGGAGPSMHTPEAQLQRSFTWRLALLPHAGSWQDAEVWRDSAEFAAPIRAISSTEKEGDRKPIASGISVKGGNAILSSVKQAEDGRRLIVRLYNPTDKATETVVMVPGGVVSAETTNLEETAQTAHPVNADGSIALTLAPKKIVTLGINPKAHQSQA